MAKQARKSTLVAAMIGSGYKRGMGAEAIDARVFDLPDVAATSALAARVAAQTRRGDVVTLDGELGSGKTTFARGVITFLCNGPVEVPSPTFTLVQTYSCPRGTIWHFDLYRLARADEVYELGIEEAFAEGISLIEWPARMAALLPHDRLDVLLSEGAESGHRRAALQGHGDWARRLAKI
ncbi:MAG TPA: tRNA (adenosine(37)-N6)-threonylcarbamoyltransferase complex ATPase subunit type 1 TsaE [Candidatus Cybelea sp.]|nr:tRNA (adenosine(37)-N6)-threonylcarbamoyltransferase complex ATPase subunit type 1 TsaE [Candidatus Cybelea sp.]